MNKTIWQEHKVLLVLSILFLIIFSSFSTSENKINDDYVLLDKIIKKIKIQKPNAILSLDSNNNNDYVISMVKQLKDYDLLNNKFKFDSLKTNIGIKSDELNEILNKNQYDFMISQSEKSNWDFKKIDVFNIKQYNKKKVISKQLKIYISKPIYSIDNKYALIFVNSTWGGIFIYKKEKRDWVEYKLISPILH